MDLIEFLQARLGEDEATARACDIWPAPWSYQPNGSSQTVRSAKPGVSLVAHCEWSKQARHIVRWDPARVLAEVEAKRAILSRWTSDAQFPDFHGGYEEAINDAALALAQPYADHPDFDPAWLAVPA